MRPIIRGSCPLEEDGSERIYAAYGNARSDLISRLGQYCSYCEMHLGASLAVEHVLPKTPKGADEIDDARALSWNNFLLACANCNSIKGQKEHEPGDVLWPDSTNPFFFLLYSEGGRVGPKPDIEDIPLARVKNTIDLVGLDRIPPDDGSASDRRWSNRRDAWGAAIESKKGLAENNILALRRQIILTALGWGHWSVWMTVFNDDTDMLSRLIQAFTGTGSDCFDAADGYVAIDFTRT